MIWMSRNDEHRQLILNVAAGHANFRSEAGPFLASDRVLRYKERDRASEDNDRIPLFDGEKQQKTRNSGPSRSKYAPANG